MALGTGMVIILYLLANIAYLAALPLRGDSTLAQKLEEEKQAAGTADAKAELETKYAESTFQLGIDHAKDDRVATAVMELASPNFGAPFMAVAIMISTFGCVNGMTLMGARLYYAMARDQLFFQSVGRLNQRGVPAAGLILQGIWSILLIFSGKYSDLLDYVMFAVLLFYVLTVVGLFILRRKQPLAERPVKAFGYPFIPGLYVVLCALIMLDLLIVKPVYTWPGLIIVLAGIPVYFLWRLIQRLPAARG
jgi:APA family basic amino acid/polyamine antiporter